MIGLKKCFIREQISLKVMIITTTTITIIVIIPDNRIITIHILMVLKKIV